MVINWSRNKFTIVLRTSGIIAIPDVLYLIPLDWFCSQPSICIYKFFTGHECYGCGITRAILFVLHFQYSHAFQLNRGIIIIFPLLLILWIKSIIKVIIKSSIC